MKNEHLQDFIKAEVSKQRDGDYEVLLAEVINQEIIPESALRSSSATLSFRNCLLADEIDLRATFVKGENTESHDLSLAYVLKDLEDNFPLLQIAVPNMETASWESIVSKEAPFYVAFLPFDYEEGDDVLAYDQDGNEHLLDGKNEPKEPVIVIGMSERITSVPTAEITEEYKNLNTYFTNEDRTFYSLGYENNEINSDNATLRSGTKKIWKAKFASQSAMKQYEPWTKGRPEVAVTISNGLGYKEKEFGDKGWWNAAENVLNYTIPIKHERPTGSYYVPLYFGWFELDYEINIKKKTTSVPVYNENGMKFSIIIPIYLLGDSNDFIGENVVQWNNQNGQKYETKNGKHGDGDFYFWIIN